MKTKNIPEKISQLCPSAKEFIPPNTSIKERAKGYRYFVDDNGGQRREIAILKEVRGGRITVFVAETSLNGKPLPDKFAENAVAPSRDADEAYYPKGFNQDSEQYGLSSFTKPCPSLNPKNNGVYRLKIETTASLHKLLIWYFQNQESETEIPEKLTSADESRAGTSQNTHESAHSDHDRQRVPRDILERRGQPRFRKELLRSYGSTCCVTGSQVEAVLEAAHIVPVAKGGEDTVSNGLLLRSDIHTLFDLGLLTIDEGFRIALATQLIDSEYAYLHGNEINMPENKNEHPTLPST